MVGPNITNCQIFKLWSLISPCANVSFCYLVYLVVYPVPALDEAWTNYSLGVSVGGKSLSSAGAMTPMSSVRELISEANLQQ